jgi:hypothetical protein
VGVEACWKHVALVGVFNGGYGGFQFALDEIGVEAVAVEACVC